MVEELYRLPIGRKANRLFKIGLLFICISCLCGAVCVRKIMKLPSKKRQEFTRWSQNLKDNKKKKICWNIVRTLYLYCSVALLLGTCNDESNMYRLHILVCLYVEYITMDISSAIICYVMRMKSGINCIRRRRTNTFVLQNFLFWKYKTEGD